MRLITLPAHTATSIGTPSRSREESDRITLDDRAFRAGIDRGQSSVQLGLTRNQILGTDPMTCVYVEKTAWTDATNRHHAPKFGPLYHSQRWRFAT